ncbi:MAG TPA: 5'-nucleotidase C-terminal domain-containing protein [Anaeromyxobacteraceae bacterium]|nr:5'-nucleotidase C-terminal domain-containing protein [Anaeromyxobacteraceae bacterium]
MLPHATLLLALVAAERCVEVLSLADVHGHAAELPRLAARMSPIRAGGPSLLFDAGDSLQGTLAARLSEGEAVVAALGAMGVDAAAIGNHDFDYGAAALRRRMATASYPFLAANLRDASTGELPAWKNLYPSRLLRPPGGPVVGVFGLSARDTPSLTMPRNVEGLAFLPEAEAAARQAAALRREGAEVVVGVVHLGGYCTDLGDPDDLSSCEAGRDLFRLARSLPPGLVDALLGGHTHGFVNHRVNGVALVQAGSRAEAAGWVTLCTGRPARFHPPIRAAGDGKGGGAPEDARVASAVEPFLAAARSSLREPLGVSLPWPLARDSRGPSPFGVAVAQAVREALRTDFALINGGSLRTDLAPGALTLGQVYEALPFEDSLAVVRVRGAALVELLRALEGAEKGFPQLAGLRFDGGEARTCDGAPLDLNRTYAVGTNEFIASGGDGTQSVLARLPPGSLTMRKDLHQRDAFVAWLRRVHGSEPPAACP